VNSNSCSFELPAASGFGKYIRALMITFISSQLASGTCAEITEESATAAAADGAKNDENEDENDGESKKKVSVAAASVPELVVGKYDLIDSWTQTLDFSKKKKGTQCDAIEIEIAGTQVKTIHSVLKSHARFVFVTSRADMTH
jgi:hypothetical protein